MGQGRYGLTPHAENTGLVISDVAKIGSFSEISKCSRRKFRNSEFSFYRDRLI